MNRKRRLGLNIGQETPNQGTNIENIILITYHKEAMK